MRVFNLSSKTIDYRGKHISPGGGYEDYPDMTFVPDRDLALESSRVLAFGKLPNWWLVEKSLQAAPAPTPVKPQPKKAQVKSYPLPQAPVETAKSSGWVEKPIIQKAKE
jgi:hypothetical protein